MVSELGATVSAISPALQAEMQGRSWHDVPGCPAFAELRLVELPHYDLAGQVRRGELVVHASIAAEVVAIFERLFACAFPIARMERVDRYDGSDAASMAANNSSAFNFRAIEGSQELSHHALGLAIDLNPVQNPWVRGGRVDPAAGRAYLDRSVARPGLIVMDGPVVRAFRDHGWHWGGTFPDMRDYHHFSKLPR